MHGCRACHRFHYPSRRKEPSGGLERRGKIHELSDVQAIGAAAENMALIAAEMGIGSLWNGNIFFAYDELKNWLDAGEMVLAMSFGYPAHHPSPLNRKKKRTS